MGSGEPLWISVLGFRRDWSWAPYSSWCTSYLCVLSSSITLKFAITAMPMTASCTPSSTYETRTATGMCCSGWRCVWRRTGWLLTNKLKLNTDKTEFMVIMTPHYQTTYGVLQPAVSIVIMWHQRACSVLPRKPRRHHGLHRGHAWQDPEHQVHHVPSPAHHQQHQTLPGQGHLCQGRAVLGLTTVTLCWWASLPLHCGDCSWPRTMPPAQWWVCAGLTMYLRHWRRCTGCQSTSESATNWCASSTGPCTPMTHRSTWAPWSATICQAGHCALPVPLCAWLYLDCLACADCCFLVLAPCFLECTASSRPSLFDTLDF